jgi:hypothetical protein
MNRGVQEKDYDDYEMKIGIIDFYKKTFGIELMINPNKYGIDLLVVGGDYGVEGERAGNKEKGDPEDYWSCDRLAYKSKLGYKTLNIPIHRKGKYWQLYYYDKFPPYKEHYNPGYTKHDFCRTNYNLTQYNIIRAENFINKNYVVKEMFTENSGKYELFYCFEQKYVETYDLVNGIYVLRDNVLVNQ